MKKKVIKDDIEDFDFDDKKEGSNFNEYGINMDGLDRWIR